MNIDELKQILDIIREHGITEFELEREDGKLRVRKAGGAPAVEAEGAALRVAATPAAPTAAVSPARPSGPTPVGGTLEESSDVMIVKSPIVGSFYRAPEPGARPFVEVGTIVKKGQVLCIIEAMKLMNEINSEYDGEVVAIFAENGQAVQYGERLFAIKR